MPLVYVYALCSWGANVSAAAVDAIQGTTTRCNLPSQLAQVQPPAELTKKRAQLGGDCLDAALSVALDVAHQQRIVQALAQKRPPLPAAALVYNHTPALVVDCLGGPARRCGAGLAPCHELIQHAVAVRPEVVLAAGQKSASPHVSSTRMQ